MASQNPTTVEAFHKVTLLFAPEPPSTDSNDPTAVEFIAGLGVAGLTPFEQQLIGRRVGDTFKVDLSSDCWEASMGPIPSLPKAAWANATPQSVTVTIAATQPAKPEEVIKEMAHMGGGCSGCDCGCGGH